MEQVVLYGTKYSPRKTYAAVSLVVMPAAGVIWMQHILNGSLYTLRANALPPHSRSNSRSRLKSISLPRDDVRASLRYSAGAASGDGSALPASPSAAVAEIIVAKLSIVDSSGSAVALGVLTGTKKKAGWPTGPPTVRHVHGGKRQTQRGAVASEPAFTAPTARPVVCSSNIADTRGRAGRFVCGPRRADISSDLPPRIARLRPSV